MLQLIKHNLQFRQKNANYAKKKFKHVYVALSYSTNSDQGKVESELVDACGKH